METNSLKTWKNYKNAKKFNIKKKKKNYYEKKNAKKNSKEFLKKPENIPKKSLK